MKTSKMEMREFIDIIEIDEKEYGLLQEPYVECDCQGKNNDSYREWCQASAIEIATGERVEIIWQIREDYQQAEKIALADMRRRTSSEYLTEEDEWLLEQVTEDEIRSACGLAGDFSKACNWGEAEVKR